MLQTIINIGVGLAIIVIGVYLMIFEGFLGLVNLKDRKLTPNEVEMIRRCGCSAKGWEKIANKLLFLTFAGMGLIAFAIFFMLVNGIPVLVIE